MLRAPDVCLNKGYSCSKFLSHGHNLEKIFQAWVILSSKMSPYPCFTESIYWVFAFCGDVFLLGAVGIRRLIQRVKYLGSGYREEVLLPRQNKKGELKLMFQLKHSCFPKGSISRRGPLGVSKIYCLLTRFRTSLRAARNAVRTARWKLLGNSDKTLSS